MYAGGAWKSWACVGFGLWLLTLPMVAGSAVVDDGLAGWNLFLSGLAAAGVGLATLERPEAAEHWARPWTKLALGLWLSISPFLLGFWHDPVLLWSYMLPGLIMGGDALASGRHPDRPLI